MSEVAPNQGPFHRQLPELPANEVINAIIRDALRKAAASEKAKGHATREAYAAAVAKSFYLQLGTGSIEPTIEEMARKFPDPYITHQRRKDTAYKYLNRADGYRGYAHPSLLSPLVSIKGKNAKDLYYVGIDKLGHLVQQGYDYLLIFRAVEERLPGMGKLFADGWGLWTEGEEITEQAIEHYLTSRNMPSDLEYVKELRKEILEFLTTSETVKWLSPTPEKIKNIDFLRNLAQAIGIHQRGIFGDASDGIISHADIVANDAGLQMYFDLEQDPDGFAERFDIADYVTPQWDEEVLKPKYSPIVEERIEEAVQGKMKSHITSGIGLGIDVVKGQFSVSFPFLYYSTDNVELRLRAGGSIPLTDDTSAFYTRSTIFPALDVSARIYGLHYAYFSTALGITPQITSAKPLDGLRPTIEVGYEFMFFGWASFQASWVFDPRDLSSSAKIGVLMFWRWCEAPQISL